MKRVKWFSVAGVWIVLLFFTVFSSARGGTQITDEGVVFDDGTKQTTAATETEGVVSDSEANGTTRLTNEGIVFPDGTTQTTAPVNNGPGGIITPGTSNQLIAAGYWSSANTVSGDSDLVASNIKKNVKIFDVTGSYEGGGGSYSAGVSKTGQVRSYGARDDGALQKGVPWPSPRFTDNGNGTVTDNLTGLIWLKNANCFGIRTWNNALALCNGLNSGECGLTDGSAEGDWRLPNLKELLSLLDFGRSTPVLPSGHPFANVQSEVEEDVYWSSTTLSNDTNRAWIVTMAYGNTGHAPKSRDRHVWPVRGGQ